MIKTARVSFPIVLITIFILSPILSIQSTASPALSYTLPLTILAIAWIIRKGKIRMYGFCWLAIALWISSFLSSLIGVCGINIQVIKYLSFVLFYICTSNDQPSTRDLKFVFKASFVVSLVISILIILSYFAGIPHLDIDSNAGGRYSIDIIRVHKNPNYLTAYINIVLYICMYYLCFKRLKNKIKCIFILSICVFLIAIYLSGTRASLLTSSIIFSLCLIKLIKQSSYRLVGLVVILITSSICYIILQSALIENFIGDRNFFEDAARTDAWTLAFDFILKKPLFGYGNGSWQILATNYVIEYLHNIYLELILNQGIVGFIIYILLLFNGISRTKKSDKFFIIVFLFTTSFPLFFQNGIIDVNLWRCLVLNRLIINFSQFSNYEISKIE